MDEGRDSDETFNHSHWVDPETGERLSYKEIAEKEPVFLYLFFAIGLYVTMVSWTGLWGVESPRNRCCLPFYAHNLLFMWMCSIVLSPASHFRKRSERLAVAEHEHSIKDITGATKKMYDTMSENLFVVQIMSLLLVFVQTTSLVLTAALRRSIEPEYSSARLKNRTTKTKARRRVCFLEIRIEIRIVVVARILETWKVVIQEASAKMTTTTTSWSERMKLKYGVDVSKYALFMAKRPPPSHNKKKKYPGQSNPELAEKANFCGVM